MIVLILSFLNISLIPVFAFIDDGGGFNQPSFDPNDYEIDYSKKHHIEEWKHEGGHAFSDNARVFYNIPSVKMVPCKTYQEYANKAQMVSDSITTVLGFFPGVGAAINAGYEVSGLADRWANHSGSEIGMLNEIVYYYLEGSPGKGFFFFEPSSLNEIQKIEVTFCDCEMEKPGFLGTIESFIDLFPQEDVLEGMSQKDIEKNFYKISPQDIGKKISQEIMQKVVRKGREIIKERLIKKTKKKVGHIIAKTALKKTTKKVVGKTIGRFLVPGFYNIIDKSIDKGAQIYQAESCIKDKIILDVKNNSYEKTVGFALHMLSEDKLQVYEIRQNNANYQISYYRTNFYDISKYG